MFWRALRWYICTMETKIHNLKELIERKREVLKWARSGERDTLEEELADMEITLRLLELTHANRCM